MARLFKLKEGESFWPEFWSTERFKELRDETGISNHKWQALYMQDPIPQDGNIIKWEWWKSWLDDKPPKKIGFTFLSLDTARYC